MQGVSDPETGEVVDRINPATGIQAILGPEDISLNEAEIPTLSSFGQILQSAVAQIIQTGDAVLFSQQPIHEM